MGGAISRQKTDTFVGKKETPKKKKKNATMLEKCCKQVLRRGV